MSKSKQQGTAWETAVVDRLTQHGTISGMHAKRIAEGGSKDEGDVEFYHPGGDRIVVECKATQALNVTRVLGKARAKSSADITVLAWKRLIKTGKKVRQPDGEKEVVVLTLDDFIYLMTR